ncbi:hypothetical protein HID58_075085 [Brassica napus]|uniref:Uncharacterized protein n=1 Tax=Brassica napus TaxID=3708 RepID=A0ABQ7YLB0_BRANA|nr:hypothetical protein HID58_075085 [Brassica napus]
MNYSADGTVLGAQLMERRQREASVVERQGREVHESNTMWSAPDIERPWSEAQSSISSRGELHRHHFLREEAESQMTKGKRDLGHPTVRIGPSRVEPGTNQASARKARYFAGCR